MPPAQVPRMVQQLVGNCIPLAKQRFNGAPKVNGIPQDDRCPYHQGSREMRTEVGSQLPALGRRAGEAGQGRQGT